jgi:PAS domain S-box-containing protein/putative nucleotidyltransferase with HDIG domain
MEDEPISDDQHDSEFYALSQTINEIVYKIDNEGKFTYLNAAVRELGYEPSELIGKHFSHIIVPPEASNISRKQVLPKYTGKVTGDDNAPKLFDERRHAQRKTCGLEIRLVAKGKSKPRPGVIEDVGKKWIIAEVSSSGIYRVNPEATSGVFIGTVGVIKDITSRKIMESELRKYSENLEELIKQRTEELDAANKKLTLEVIERKQTIADLKQAEARIRHLNDVLLTISEINRIIVEIDNEEELLRKACTIPVKRDIYQFVRIDFTEIGTFNLQPVAHAGFAEDYLASKKVTWDDSEYGRGPSGAAVKTGQISLIEDVIKDETYRPWLHEAQNYGYITVASLPLRIGKTVIGTFNVFSNIKGVFDHEEIEYLEELASDISLGIEKIRQREELRQSEEKYYTIVEKGNEGIVIIQDGVITFANSRISEFTGYPPNEAVGKPFIDFVHPEYLGLTMERYQKRMSGEIVPSRYEISMRMKDGGEVPVELNANKIEYQGKLVDMVIIRNITERKKAEEKIKQSFEQLKQNFNGITEAIASTIEMRDPYTAGHQVRVAHLAQAIAREMELGEEQVHNIYTAGLIHDIGKISVPAEILSKPGKLSAIEFSLIKNHPQAGYDILKNIDFPFPLARWVLEHHERLDGSGYPQGLLGKDIDIEVRILAVADVVEAMASHRPYRAALGIDKALEEISLNKSKVYDPNVVDTCHKLFYEKGFRLEEPFIPQG